MADMSYEFKKLSDVETIEDVNDEDTVLVISGGSVKQVSKEKVGGNSSTETTYFVKSGNSVRTGTDWDTGTEVTIDDLFDAYSKGPVKIFKMYNGSLDGVGPMIDGYSIDYNGTKHPVFIDTGINAICNIL